VPTYVARKGAPAVGILPTPHYEGVLPRSDSLTCADTTTDRTHGRAQQVPPGQRPLAAVGQDGAALAHLQRGLLLARAVGK